MNILILKPCCLGDVLMTTPLVATLRAAFPEARIDYAVGAWARPAVVTNPDVDEVLPLFEPAPSRWGMLWGALAAAWRLRRRRYDLAFIPEPSFFAHLTAYLAGVPRRFGIASGARAMLLTDAVPDRLDRHEVDVYLALAEAAGLKRQLRREMKYVPTQMALERALQLLRGPGFDRLPFRVALFPGGGANPGTTLFHKRWPAERFSLLANDLIERYGGGVILLGDDSEQELNFTIRNDIAHPVLDLTGMLDIDGMGAVMQLCDAVIANDTGPMHLAVSVGTPTVGIFGPTAARNYGPYGDRHRAVQSNIWCGPCFKIGGPMEGCGAACMSRITVGDLVSVLETRPARAVG
ncbi:MAG TPA: lipopolysaccharide heptosyltransferase II [Candidatus Dormibacteraeota bacterium]|jgi:lipopolysaccharide heptosyltransferase II|nr:lipopolysaccharide heptosyltransferase II [Candidatus Dormibacteraeota bacterium]